MKDTIENLAAGKNVLDRAIDKTSGNIISRILGFIVSLAIPSVLFVGLIYGVINLADADNTQKSKTTILQGEINLLTMQAEMVKACLSETKEVGPAVLFYCDKASKAFEKVALIPVEKEILKEKAYKAMLYNFNYKLRTKQNELKGSSSNVFSYGNIMKALVNEFTFSAVMYLTFLLSFYVLYRQGRANPPKDNDSTNEDTDIPTTENTVKANESLDEIIPKSDPLLQERSQ